MKDTGIVIGILVIISLFLGGLYLNGMCYGRDITLNGLLADGYSITIDRSIRVGEGRYVVRIWECGVGWAKVDR